MAIAALLALACAAAVALPLVWRRGTSEGAAQGAGVVAGSPVAAAAVAVLLVGGGAALYATWSSWSWPAPQAAGASSPTEMVSQLVRRLEREPEDLEGWLMLGRSYVALGQLPLAIRAYQRADRLADGRNAEALEGWAEALALGNEAELAGRAGRLFDRALELAPTAPKALFFGAVAAQRRGELPLAVERFEKLLATEPPENVRPVIEQQVATLKAAIAGAPMAAMAGAAKADGPGAAPAGGAAAPGGEGAAASSGAAASGSAVVRVRVRLAPALAGKVPAGAPLFVFVRIPGRPGPPVAVKRLEATLPQLVELSQADAMMGGGFAAGDKVDVTARVALGGQPTASPGDPVGQTGYDVGRDGEKELVIDRLTP